MPIRFILFLLLICYLMVMCSCSKVDYYVEHPTCQRVYMYSDKYNSDTVYIGTVEVHPFKPYENYLCNDDLIKWRNTKVFLQGCERDGYEQFRYSVGSEISKPVIYKH